MKKSQMSHQATLAATAGTRTAATGVPHIPGTHTETTLSPKSERTIRKWIANGSLRARQRGTLLEYSISDLKALVTGHSPQGKNVKE